MVTIVEEAPAAAQMPQHRDVKEQESKSESVLPPKVGSGSKNGLEREGEGWETASEGDEGEGEEKSPETVSIQEDRFEDALTEEEQRQKALSQGNAAKVEGNQLYVAGKFDEALSIYATALELAPDHEDAKEMRAICLSNRAMCYLQLGHNEEAVTESTKALELNPTYVKALMRRAQGQEKLDHLEEALADMKKVLELDPANKEAARTVQKLDPVVAERREKLKEEMLGKLKDLGNSVLGRFGMSVDNFKAVKDPETGSYSISFQK
ncbi:hypothetical protein O6H91_22G064100 [Diphasiastrum complanatum]|uniref:Uncharacterized protein n=2 Tax=Diphasiastrum complanatum TaxID=34168 RepID=A0ACC2AG94_DIPCM|nr:hypothetical protein O6H91_22G064100 [Diphasiastrum complanatum]KAJ7516584.1 hypothetical protein O6H91_22G064100 [Diphasiastrum complanatum]